MSYDVEDDEPRRRIVRVALRITLLNDHVLAYRHTDVDRAGRILAQISDMMHACFKDPNENPFVDSVMLVDDTVAVNANSDKPTGEGGTSDLAMVKRERATSIIDVRRIESAALVCPACLIVVLDSMPGHIVENGECSDPTTEGHDVKGD